MPFSYESEHKKFMTSLIINLSLAVFYRQSLSCKVIDKSQGDLNSSNCKYFTLCPPWLISVALLLLEASTLIFCVLFRQCQSLHTVCFQIFAAPVVWSILRIAVLRPQAPLLVSIVQSFLKASSSSSRVRIRPLRSGSFVFETLVFTAPSSSLNLLLAILPGPCQGCHPTAGFLAQSDGARKGPCVPLTWKQLSFPEICRCFWDQFSLECQVYTFHATECRPRSFPTPTQLLLFNFSTFVG